MNVRGNPMTVSSYCEAMLANKISVNRDYQRSSAVWPKEAASYLIETVIMGFPVPKLFLHQITDLANRETRMEIVDGQQRSMTLLKFYNGDFALSSRSEIRDAAGKKYEDLSDEYQANFLNYSLGIDLILEATPEEIREVFRRMNSYTVPLNPEEQRYAFFQGQFKWFVHDVTKQIDDYLVDMGAFNTNQLVRMQDSKLITEISHALCNGIQTTNKNTLWKLYEDHNSSFDEKDVFSSYLLDALELIHSWAELYSTRIMKPFSIYSLTLAIIWLKHQPQNLAQSAGDLRGEIVSEYAVRNLSRLSSDAGRDLEEEEDEEAAYRFPEFVTASSTRTNVADQRETRFRWYIRALTEESID